jgi:hypothetical protein
VATRHRATAALFTAHGATGSAKARTATLTANLLVNESDDMNPDAGAAFDEMSPPRTCHNRAHPDRLASVLIMGYWWCDECNWEANELTREL